MEDASLDPVALDQQLTEHDFFDHSLPSITYILPRSKIGLVLVLDISQRMNPRRWNKVRDAVFRITSSLPAGTSSFAVVTFDGASSRINVNPTVVRSDNRPGLLGRVPHRLSADRGPGCVVCGLEAALDLDYGSIVLVSASGVSRDNLEGRRRMRDIRMRVERESIPIHHVSFDDGGDRHDDEHRIPIELSKYGSRFSLPGEADDLLQRLSTTLLVILHRVGGPNLVQSHSSTRRWDGRQIRGTFRVEESLRNNLWLVLTGPSKEDVESLNITSPSGRQLSFPRYENGIVYFKLEGPSESGIWSYSTHLHHAVKNGALVSMEVFGEASSVESVDSPVKVEAWTNVNRGEKTNGTVIVYAKVSQDRLPILDAKVVAKIDKPGLDREGESKVTLFDNGGGYPDVTANDGVYSAYLTDYAAEAGFYSVKIEADNNNGAARVANPFNKASSAGSGQTCCGSRLKTGFSIPTPEFNRISNVDSAFVEWGARYVVKSDSSPVMQDIFPPGRITDLALTGTSNDSSLSIELSWTATGDDFNLGTASFYELRCFTSADNLLLNEGHPVHESILPTPSSSGSRQTASVNLPFANKVFYYTINAVDEAGNAGQASNAAAAFVVEMSTTTEMRMSFVVVNSSSSSSNLGPLSIESDVVDRETMVILIAAAIAAFVLILSIFFFVCVCRSKRRSKMRNSDGAEESVLEGKTGDPAVNVNHATAFSVTSTVPDLNPDFKTSFDTWKATSTANGAQVVDFDLFGHFPTAVTSGPTSWSYNHSGVGNNYAMLSTSHPQAVSLTPSLAHPLSLPPAHTNHHVGLPMNDFISSSDMGGSSNSNSPTDAYYGSVKNSD